VRRNWKQKTCKRLLFPWDEPWSYLKANARHEQGQGRQKHAAQRVRRDQFTDFRGQDQEQGKVQGHRVEETGRQGCGGHEHRVQGQYTPVRHDPNRTGHDQHVHKVQGLFHLRDAWHAVRGTRNAQQEKGPGKETQHKETRERVGDRHVHGHDFMGPMNNGNDQVDDHAQEKGHLEGSLFAGHKSCNNGFFFDWLTCHGSKSR